MALQREKRQATCREMQSDLEGLLVGWGLSIGPHQIAAYIQELELKNGEPLSAAVAPAPVESPKVDTRPGHTPAPVRVRTGPRPALARGDSAGLAMAAES